MTDFFTGISVVSEAPTVAVDADILFNHIVSVNKFDGEMGLYGSLV